MHKLDQNEMHIVQLKKNNGKLTSETFYYESLPKPAKDLIQKLEVLMIQSKSMYSMYEFIRNTRLKEYSKYRNYCVDISGTTKKILPFQIRNKQDIAILKVEIDNNVKSYFKSKRKQYKTQKSYEKAIQLTQRSNYQYRRQEIVDDIIFHSTAYIYEKNCEMCMKAPDVIAISHRERGFKCKEVEIDSKYKFQINSNFGFGNSSYFHLVILYNDIKIVPYSQWISYRYAKTADILRYTQNYDLKCSEWQSLFNYVVESYNLMTISEEAFIKKYVIDECKNMVIQLEAISKAENWDGIKSILTLSKYKEEKPLGKRNFLLYKSEKISGAIDFINSIKENVILSNLAESLIYRITECNRSVKDEICKEIHIINEELQILSTKLDELTNTLTQLKQNVEDNYNNECNRIEPILKHLLPPTYNCNTIKTLLHPDNFNKYAIEKEQSYDVTSNTPMTPEQIDSVYLRNEAYALYHISLCHETKDLDIDTSKMIIKNVYNQASTKYTKSLFTKEKYLIEFKNTEKEIKHRNRDLTRFKKYNNTIQQYIEVELLSQTS